MLSEDPAAIAAVQNAIERLRRIRWEANDTRINSTIMLTREYFRRSALWAMALDSPDWGPIFDIAKRFCDLNGDTRSLPGYVFLESEPDYRGPGTDPLEDSIIALHQHWVHLPHPPSDLMSRTCYYFLRWESIAANPKVKAFGLPNPYEPLIVMYERGGSFYSHHGDILFYPTGGFRPGSTAQRANPKPLVALNAKALDRLDQPSDVKKTTVLMRFLRWFDRRRVLGTIAILFLIVLIAAILFPVFAKVHHVVPRPKHQSPFLFISWSPFGDRRREDSFILYDNGSIDEMRFFSGGTARDQGGMEDKEAFYALEKTPDLPQGLGSERSLSDMRLLIVSLKQGPTWNTQFYDRQNLPAPIQHILDLVKFENFEKPE